MNKKSEIGQTANRIKVIAVIALASMQTHHIEWCRVVSTIGKLATGNMFMPVAIELAMDTCHAIKSVQNLMQ